MYSVNVQLECAYVLRSLKLEVNFRPYETVHEYKIYMNKNVSIQGMCSKLEATGHLVAHVHEPYNDTRSVACN